MIPAADDCDDCYDEVTDEGYLLRRLRIQSKLHTSIAEMKTVPTMTHF